jgi:prepilin-type N-terminal cleavage/methylation domain-containing protein
MKKTKSGGFTLLELMLVISISAILIALSIPVVGRFQRSIQLNGNTDQMASMMRRARQAAVMKNVDVVFQFNMTNNTFSYFEDDDGDGVHDNGEYKSETIVLSTGVVIDSHTLSTNKVTFGPKGNTMESGTIVLANLAQQKHTISIFGGTGNVQVE